MMAPLTVEMIDQAVARVKASRYRGEEYYQCRCGWAFHVVYYEQTKVHVRRKCPKCRERLSWLG